MWRSIAIARASFARRSGSKLWSFQNQSQVLSKTPSPKPCPSHLPSNGAFSANQRLGDPRYFSHSSLDHSEVEQEEESRLDGDSDRASPDVRKIDGSHVEASLGTEGLGLGLEESGDGADPLEDDFGSVEQPIGESDEQKTAIDVEMLEKVLSLLENSADESLESSLNGLELSLNEDFVLRASQTRKLPGANLIRFTRWTMEKERFQISATVIDALARGVFQNLKRNETYALWDLIKEIGERDSKLINAETLNALIGQLSILGKGKAAFEVFNEFEKLGCVPNADTYYFTIEALCRRSIYGWAWEVCEKMLSGGILPDSERIGQIIRFFCKGQKLNEAHLAYLAAKAGKRLPPQSAVKFLIGSLSRVDETVELAHEMLDDISPDARKYAINQFSDVIKGLCRVKSVDRAKELLLNMVEAGPPPGNTVFNCVIGGLSKAGDVKEAVEMLRLMQKRGLKPDVYTYSVIMSGYAKGGLMDEACKFLGEAKKEHSKLCPATFHTLIRGYCRLNDYDKALKLLSEMKKYGVEPNVDEYNKLIQSLCLGPLDWKRAEKLVEEMKQKGMFLPGITRGLINAVKELEQETIVAAKADAEA